MGDLVVSLKNAARGQRSQCWVGAGSLSLQIWGCEIQEDNHSRGFWDFYYDGEPFLSNNLETHSWMMSPSWAQSSAVELKKLWDTDRIHSKNHWAYIQGELCGKLTRYLESWIGFRESTGNLPSPAASVQGKPLYCGMYASVVSGLYLIFLSC
jgi:hypothetical protein